MKPLKKPLGLGCGQIGSDSLSDADAFALLDEAANLGIELLDTARGYGKSEERIGAWAKGKSERPKIVSKCGYSVPGFENWTPECIAAGVDLALQTMQLDYLDGMILHSCDLETLKREGLLEALEGAKKAGKVRAIGYSGENEALAYAASLGRCDILETSVNLFDQWSLKNVVSKTTAFVIAKRPLGNAPWQHETEPTGSYAEEYWRRMKALELEEELKRFGISWDEAALRFSAHASGVSCAITGTSKAGHLQRNAQIVAEGPLPSELLNSIEKAYARKGYDWRGEI